METFKTWATLSPEQIEAIDSFKPPVYYRFFYKLYKKFLSYAVYAAFLTAAVLMVLSNSFGMDLFIAARGVFFFIMGITSWALSAYLVKHYYTKSYARKIGLSLKNWNILTAGMTYED
jgi:ABC-type uncharacterized transport system permease subunit